MTLLSTVNCTAARFCYWNFMKNPSAAVADMEAIILYCR